MLRVVSSVSTQSNASAETLVSPKLKRDFKSTAGRGIASRSTATTTPTASSSSSSSLRNKRASPVNLMHSGRHTRSGSGSGGSGGSGGSDDTAHDEPEEQEEEDIFGMNFQNSNKRSRTRECS